MSEHNPYRSPTEVNLTNDQPSIVIDPADKTKLDAVIKDASQFWLAIILCTICSAIGAIIIPFWYLVRLLQWNGLAEKYPALTQPGAPAGSIQAKFISARWKLIVGLIVGASIFALLLLYILIVILALASNAA